jgi:hypothetical protein
MTRKDPKQPIPLYPTAVVTPGPGTPLKFPKPALTDEQLRNLVMQYVRDSLLALNPDVLLAFKNDYSLRDQVAVYVARVLHKTALQLSEAEIIEMSEQQFEAFCRSVLEEDE